ncbi:MAG: acyclic terpene utilization AtuA family protein [Pikeienuella sp.]|uniref:acyclic terpene utilization AtuA family protein n=1 Tax=Pikeienuella sp. TaxID=2831957 RepID=UPI00391C6CDB
MAERLVVGGASGYWGEASHATAQLLAHPGLDVLIYDYLAEITLSIMARARAKDPGAGFAPDFVSAAMAPNLAEIAAKGVKVVSNAGGLNPEACAAALRAEIAKRGLKLRVAVVEGDDLTARAADFAERREMFSGAAFPDPAKVASINAYLGAFPIAAALSAGADIVVTGRVADSATVLAACIWRFGWGAGDLDPLAGGSLAGHILECGPQATGGNFTDWREAGDIADIGYPLAEIGADGAFTVTKPAGTAGLVTRESVAEQMLYEIGDPQAYLLPDVVCDFSGVRIAAEGPGRVRVSGAKGGAPTGRLKVSCTWQDGFRAGYLFNFNGREAGAKARAFAEAGLARARAKLRAMNAPDFAETCIEVTGGRPGAGAYEEVALKTAVRHEDSRAVGLFLKETMGAGLATPPGLHGFTGAGRPKPSPVIRLFSFLIDTAEAPPRVTLEGEPLPFAPPAPPPPEPAPAPHPFPEAEGEAVALLPLEALAVARSGDKGDAANVGIIPRRPEYLPWIAAALTDEAIRAAIPFAKGRIERFHLPGISAMNLLLHEALGGGGVASLLNDAQGKGYAQRLLALDIPVPAALAEGLA